MKSSPPLYLRYWGKADPAYVGDPKWHPLGYHCLDVTAVAAAWWDASATIRRVFVSVFPDARADEALLKAWLLFFVALHDVGKLDMRFQLKAPDTLQEIWPTVDLKDIDRLSSRGFDHGLGGYLAAMRELSGWTRDDSKHGPQRDAWRAWIAAVTAHHGDVPVGKGGAVEYAETWIIENDRVSREDWVQELSALILAPAGLSLTSAPPACTTAAQALLAGFCAVCDWIGSNTEYFPYQGVDRDPAGYLGESLNRALRSDVIVRCGLASAARPSCGVQALLGTGESPRGIQTLIESLPAAPSMTIVEAPTGSGKTEAALAYAWQLLNAGLAESIVFALPTQATANAMLARAERFALHAFESANVVLAHGKRQLHQGFRRLVEAGNHRTAQGPDEATAQCAAWLAQSRKRVFLGQIGVCTVDQVLLSVLPVRHKFVRAFGLARSVLIVDEVHAYDTYMHGLLHEVLRRQKEAGGSAILLSATLSSQVRNGLLKAWAALPTSDSPYPAVWIVDGERARPLTVSPAERPAPREVEVELLKLPHAFPDRALCERIIAAAQAGGLIAVITNLVDDAQRLARLLRTLTSLPVDVFHARYRFIDRQSKELAVIEHYGRHAPHVCGRILVATQVIEQSLDLDFDWLVTQICPVDLLFQRLGRLHRHERSRPKSHASPRCSVVSVSDDDYANHKLIYGDTRVLWRTERLLMRSARIAFPAAYRLWIEEVYDEEDRLDEPEAILRAHRDFFAKQRAAHWEARLMIDTPRKAFSDDDMIITVKTRDGENSLTVLPVRDDGSTLEGTDFRARDELEARETIALNALSVPASWGSRLQGCTRDDDGRIVLSFRTGVNGAWTCTIEGASLGYTKDFGLERNADGSA